MFKAIKNWWKVRGENLCVQNKHKWVDKIDILPGVHPVWTGIECKRCKVRGRRLAFY
jgi:hypothetical protein